MYLGSRYVAVLFATVHTIGKGTDIIKSSDATIPDPQHTPCGLSLYRGSVRLIHPTYIPDKADPRHVFLGSRYVTFFTTNPQYTLWEKAQTSQNHLMRQFQIPNTHLVDCRYVAVRCASCFHHTCQMNTCDIYQHILLTLALLTYNTTFNWSPARVFGIPICRGSVHPHPQYTLWENAPTSYNHLIPQFQIPTTHLVDSRYIAVQCVSCLQHTCQISTRSDVCQTPKIFY